MFERRVESYVSNNTLTFVSTQKFSVIAASIFSPVPIIKERECVPLYIIISHEARPLQRT